MTSKVNKNELNFEQNKRNLSVNCITLIRPRMHKRVNIQLEVKIIHKKNETSDKLTHLEIQHNFKHMNVHLL